MTRANLLPLLSGYPFNSPLFRDFFEAFPVDNIPKYPPTNIELVASDPDDVEAVHDFDPYVEVTMAVAGFTKKELTIEVKDSKVTVSATGTNDEKVQGITRKSLVQQMAKRGFSNTVEFAAPVEVQNAKCKDGILTFEVHFVKPPEGEFITIK